MNYLKEIIQIADHTVNLLIAVCFIPLLLYGGYALWDSAQINHHADTSVYETYKPTSKDTSSFEVPKKINSEVFGWLTIENTHIDYPLVQASNNLKYVNTDIKGNFSLSGSIFLDCQNSNDFSDINNIIYGHNMEKNTMFGELKYFNQEEYFEKHKYGKLYYGEKWHDIEFFAFLHANAYDAVLYNADLNGEDERQNYLNYIKEHAHSFRELSFHAEDRYVALSTCTSTSTNGRYLLIGRISERTRIDKDKIE